MSFTDKQQGVIDCLFKGFSGKEIATELGMKERTVKAHVREISRKLDIDHRKYIVRVRIVYLLSQKAPYVM